MNIYPKLDIFVHLRRFPIACPIIICIFSYNCGNADIAELFAHAVRQEKST